MGRIVRLVAWAFLFATALSVLISSSTLAAARLSDGMSGYAVASWSEADGRPLGSVYGIVQTSDGYLWVGSDAGLYRFDGWRFAAWEATSHVRLPQAPVVVLAVGRDGGLWAAFAGTPDLYYLRDGRATTVGREGPTLNDITAVAEDGGGTLWVIADRSLQRLRGERWERVRVGSEGQPASTYPTSVRTGSAGEIWVGSTEGLFRKTSGADTFERLTGSPSRNTLEDWVWDVVEGSNGSVWLTDMATGFRVLTNASSKWARPESRVMGYRLLRDHARNLWVGTIGEGLWRVSDTPASEWQNIERMTPDTGLLGNSVRSLFEDDAGNLWVGTTAGLQRFTRRKLTAISDIGLAISVDEVPDAGMLVGTSNGLVTFRQGIDGRLTRSRSAQGLWVTRVHRDRRGGLWISTTSGTVYSTDNGRNVVPVISERASTYASDSNGVVWFVAGTRLYNNQSGRVQPVVIPPSWGIRQINAVFGDHSGRLWVADTQGLIGVLSTNGDFRLFGPEQGWPTRTSMQAIFEDGQHTIWIGTNKGLVRFAGDRFDVVGPSDGLPSDRIGAIVDDDYGYLWLNIDTGLVRISRTEVEAVIADRSYRPKYHIYDATDGLSGAAIVNLRATRTIDGKLWLVRGGGLTTIDPRRLVPERLAHSHAARIDLVLADNKSVEPISGVTVAAGTKNIQINYSALELTSPQRLRFRYRLEGFDTDWTNAETRRQAFYTNLPPRNYTFRVEARLDGEDWRDASTWAFTLQPMWWQTAWFYTTLGAVLLAAAYAGWRIRLRVMRHELALVLGERTRLSREIHDTLLQSLAGLTLQLDKIRRLVPTSPDSAVEQLVRMRRYVEANIRDARTSIWDLRSPTLETRDLATAIEEFGRSRVYDLPTAFAAHVSGQVRRVAPKIESHLLRIGQEAISNAVRHARAEHIEFELIFEPDTIRLRVVDDGCGFVPDLADRAGGHYGIVTMRERAQKVGGTFKLSSTARGTSVEVVVPLPSTAIERKSA